MPAHLLSTRFNTFGVDIEPDETTYYLNRQAVAALRTPDEYKGQFYVLADLALGGGWPLTSLKSPQSMDIAWIRAYRRTHPISPRQADATGEGRRALVGQPGAPRSGSRPSPG